jgi:KDO2-lipid IV(A) lauroyltransferase
MGLGQWASDEELNSLTKIEGIEHLQKAAADGAGVIILSAHFTTLEVVGRVLRIHGPVYDGVYRKNRSPFITAFLLRGREQSARKGIEKTDIKGMVRSLREGVAVWYAADQSYTGKQSALLPFFGVPAMTNTATTTLGKLGRAVAVPFFPRRLEDGTYLLTLLPPLKGFPGDDPVVDTENFTSILEDYVRRFPAQYFWIHKKFKNRPAPLPDVYSDLDSLK